MTQPRHLLPSLLLGLAVALAAVGGCERKPRSTQPHVQPTPKRVNPPLPTVPPPPVAKKHPTHEHPHGAHPHEAHAHHHHPHPHPHLDGPDGHHHPY